MSEAQPGGLVEFTLKVFNPSPTNNVTVTNITVHDPLPLQVDLVSTQASLSSTIEVITNLVAVVGHPLGIKQATATTITWRIPQLAAGEQATLKITAKVNDLAAPPPQTILNLANMTSTQLIRLITELTDTTEIIEITTNTTSTSEVSIDIPVPPTPTPTGAIVTPTPTGATVTPTPTGGTMTPTPTGATVTPTPTGATVTPTPTGRVGTPTPTKTKKPRTATPTLPATSLTPVPSLTPTPGLSQQTTQFIPPVTFLPETGVGAPPTPWSGLFLLLLFLGGGMVGFYWQSKRKD